MVNWVIVYVRTGTEKKTVDTLKNILDSEYYKPFIPVKETPYRRRGVISKQQKLLFPGYVFIETKIEPNEIATNLRPILMDKIRLKDIIKLLHYDKNQNEVVLIEAERLYWTKLFNEEYCVTGSIGYLEGDKLRVISGALFGMEGEIKRVDRHRRLANVETQIMGKKIEIRVMLELIKKNTEPKNLAV